MKKFQARFHNFWQWMVLRKVQSEVNEENNKHDKEKANEQLQSESHNRQIF